MKLIDIANRITVIMAVGLGLIELPIAAAAGVDEPGLYAKFETSLGEFTCSLNYGKTPKSVASFVTLTEGTRRWLDFARSTISEARYYDGTRIHRVEAGSLIRGGSTDGLGFNGSGMEIENEFDPEMRHDKPGILGMTNRTGGPFYLTLSAAAWLDDVGTILGEVVDGMEVVTAIGNVPTDDTDRPIEPITIRSVTILRNGVQVESYDPLADELALPSIEQVNASISTGENGYTIDWEGEGSHRYHVMKTEDLRTWSTHSEGPFENDDGPEGSTESFSPSIARLVEKAPHAFFKVFKTQPDSTGELPAVKWKFKTGASIYSPAATKDGIVFFGSLDSKMYALDIASGELVWTFDTAGGIYGQAGIAGDHLYFSSEDRGFYKVNRRTGEEAWRFSLRGGLRVPPSASTPWDYRASKAIVADGTVYVGANSGVLQTINDETGTREWAFSTGGAIRSDPAITGNLVIFGSFDGNLYALDRASGDEVWRFNAGGPINSSPTVVGDRVYIGNRTGNRSPALTAVSLQTGTQLWATPYANGSWVESTATHAGSNLFIGSSDLGVVNSMDAETGSISWQTSVGGRSITTPAVTDDSVYAGVLGGTFRGVNGGFVCLDRNSGSEIWRYSFDLSSAYYQGVAGGAVLVGDLVLFGGLDGIFYALQDSRLAKKSFDEIPPSE